LRKPLPQGNGFFIACVWRCLVAVPWYALRAGVARYFAVTI
jgi:hypothetical protein